MSQPDDEWALTYFPLSPLDQNNFIIPGYEPQSKWLFFPSLLQQRAAFPYEEKGVNKLAIGGRFKSFGTQTDCQLH